MSPIDTREAPRHTSTHWYQAGRDYGWPNYSGRFVVELWAPHNRDVPADWMARFTNIPEFEARRKAQRERS